MYVEVRYIQDRYKTSISVHGYPVSALTNDALYIGILRRIDLIREPLDSTYC